MLKYPNVSSNSVNNDEVGVEAIYTCNCESMFLFDPECTSTYKAKIHVKVLTCLYNFGVIIMYKLMGV